MLERNTKGEKAYLKGRIQREHPEDSSFRPSGLYTRKEAWDAYKWYTTDARTMSRKGDGEKEVDPDRIYSTDR
jgi:hypothetical protein